MNNVFIFQNTSQTTRDHRRDGARQVPAGAGLGEYAGRAYWNSIELSGQVFQSARGFWSEGLLLWQVKKTRVGFFLGAILDICWGLVFWLSWLVLILGKFLKSHD